MPLEKRFISHYMLTEMIRIEENYCRWLAEDMRANKEVWITEFFEKSENGVGNKWLNLASEIKKISTSSIIQISDFFRESNSVFIVTEMPRGEILKPLKHYNEDRFRKIGEELLKTLILLQRNGIGFDSLSLNDIFVDNRGEIKLFFSENWILKSENESREKEIALFAIVLLNFLGFENEEKIEITQDFLKEFAPEKIYPLFEETLIDRKNHRFEALSRYFQEKMKVSVDPMIDTDEAESFKLNRSMRYVMLGILAVVMYMMLTFNNDIAKSKWFDVWRYQVLANMGISEPQRILGELYEKGYGVERDMIRSIEWYRKAAQSGNVYAQMSLGHFYDKGIGVPLDRKQALYWFTLAATNGDKIAKEYVAIYTQPAIPLRPTEDSTQAPQANSGTITKPLQQSENEKSNDIARQHYFHTYWVHSGSSNNLKKSDQFGGIYGCYEDGLKNPYELVSFNHEVRSMAVDGDGNLYWADITTGQIIKSDPNGQNTRAIVGRLFHPMGIAIDRKRKLLFWCDRQTNAKGYSGGIGRSDLEGNGVKYIVVDDLFSGGKLKVDENEAKLYIPDIVGKKIVRVDEDGHNMIGLVFAIKPEGFDIDPQKRKMYWTDDMNSGIYESDYDGRNKRIVYTYYTTNENFELLMFSPKDQRVYFGKLGPGSQSIGYTSIYDEHSARIQEYVTNFKIHDMIRN